MMLDSRARKSARYNGYRRAARRHIKGGRAERCGDFLARAESEWAANDAPPLITISFVDFLGASRRRIILFTVDAQQLMPFRPKVKRAGERARGASLPGSNIPDACARSEHGIGLMVAARRRRRRRTRNGTARMSQHDSKHTGPCRSYAVVARLVDSPAARSPHTSARGMYGPAVLAADLVTRKCGLRRKALVSR